MEFSLADGLLDQARQVPSPNFGSRPQGCEPQLLVIHNISLPPGCYGGDEVLHFFTNCLDCDAHPYFQQLRDVTVSAHLLIRRDGEAVQFVNFDRRAWHAGESSYEGRSNCNDFSIGIELEGTDDTPYTDQQYAVLSGVANCLIRHYRGMCQRDIVGHSDIAPGRKTDPGPAFDWRRFRGALALKGGGS